MKKTMYVYLIYILTPVFFFMSFEYVEGNELTIIYTANGNGKLRTCNCPGDPYGGLAERVTLIRNIRKKEEPFLLVDCGNMVSLYGDYDLKASCVLRMMNLMKYDVTAAGRNEMFKGITRARAMIRVAKFPIISATIADKTEQNLVFKPYTTRTIDGNTVAVIAVCDSSCFIPGTSREYDYRVLPANETITKILGEISPECDFIIVLSQLPPDSNRALLHDFPEIDVIVEGYGNKKYDPPVMTRNGVIVSPGGRGEFVGLLTVEKSHENITIKRSELFPLLGIPEDKKAHKIAVEYYQKRK